MSNEKQETIDDIVEILRANARGDRFDPFSFTSLADRIEAAAKRESTCEESSQVGNSENNNDKRLIAAAPELYEALAALLSCAEKDAPFTTDSRMDIAIDMARKAIEKAGGAE